MLEFFLELYWIESVLEYSVIGMCMIAIRENIFASTRNWKSHKKAMCLPHLSYVVNAKDEDEDEDENLVLLGLKEF